MSATVTVRIDKEEHVLVLDFADPRDQFIKILENLFGNISSFTYVVDGKPISNTRDLLNRIHDNSFIEIQRNTRGAYTRVAPLGFPLEIQSVQTPPRPTIQIENLHISCSSDSYEKSEDMAGLIIYSFDNKQVFELNGHRCRTGYVLIKATKNIKHINSSQGVVHGSLFKWFFDIEPDDRFVGAGFALQNDILKFNSLTFNARNDGYHDQSKSMSSDEVSLIKYVVEKMYKTNEWRKNPTASLSSLNARTSIFNPDAILPYQNHPKSSSGE